MQSTRVDGLPSKQYSNLRDQMLLRKCPESTSALSDPSEMEFSKATFGESTDDVQRASEAHRKRRRFTAKGNDRKTTVDTKMVKKVLQEPSEAGTPLDGSSRVAESLSVPAVAMLRSHVPSVSSSAVKSGTD